MSLVTSACLKGVFLWYSLILIFQWEDQHQGLSCEEFTQWKIDNDPNMQAVGLARHLEENGIGE